MMFMSFNSNTTGVTSGAGIDSAFRPADQFISPVFCEMFCRSVGPFFLAIVFSVLLRFTASDWITLLPFGIFKLFLEQCRQTFTVNGSISVYNLCRFPVLLHQQDSYVLGFLCCVVFFCIHPMYCVPTIAIVSRLPLRFSLTFI